MTKLKINNLSKFYGNVKVLEDINVSVEDGEFIVLVGPSGSGKSTILRIIAGLEQPTTGEVEMSGSVINQLSPKDRDIAMVFQNYALYPHMNVYDNLSFPLKIKNTAKEIVDKAVNETAELLSIRHYLSKKPKELSGGERQRVALGRAIIRKPKLFLMDEPLSNLDAKLRTQMRAELLKIQKTLSATVIYVTHDQTEALTMGNKIVVIDKGKVQQIGTPTEVYHKPVNTFVAGFVGSPAMNFFDFKIISNSTVDFLGERKETELPKNVFDFINKKGFLNKNLILGIRPGDMLLESSANSRENIAFPATVELIEMHGSEYLLYLYTKNTNKRTNFSIKLTGGCELKRNENVNVQIDLNKVHFFNADIQERIST